MPKFSESRSNKSSQQPPVTLKELARHLNVSPSTVSVVLNEVPGRSISDTTRARIREAAEELGYRPSMLARSLRLQQTKTIGVLLPLVGEEYHAQVLSGIANELEPHGYSYLIAQHRHDPERVTEYTRMLVSRGAEGLVAIDTRLTNLPHVPLVAVAGHENYPDVTNIVLDHALAAQLTMEYLRRTGHQHIAVVKGQPSSSDTEARWKATSTAAKAQGLSIRGKHVVQLDRDLTSPELAYSLVQGLLDRSRNFTAVVCFNDIAALGAVRALSDAGLSVPKDVSVIGFDDIRVAQFALPSITTIRQPLAHMGELAAKTLLAGIRTRSTGPHEISVAPQLIVRESTGDVSASPIGAAKLP